MDIEDAVLIQLTRRAREASRYAWAPYSKFPVGAAVLTDDGAVYGGANVENASYGLSMCAERIAIFQAVAHGARGIVAIAVYTPTPQATPPCGACRQVVAEFGPDALVICSTDDAKAERRFRLGELLPQGFGPRHL
jgi:cytidine deaminase